MIEPAAVRRFFSLALATWVALTAAFGLVSGAILATGGPEALRRLVQVGPASILPQTLLSVALAWLGVGLALALLRSDRLRRDHGIAIVGSLAILLLYLNVLRERTWYGDAEEYLLAAEHLRDGTPFQPRYLYPPFLATLCEPLLPLGWSRILHLFWVANVASLVTFYWLLRAALMRYGLGARASAWVGIAFLAINVPVLRTLGYLQVNFHVTNLALLALLAFPGRALGSGVALAAAVHLKASPLALALPFLWTRDLRWIAGFAAGLAGFAALTVVPHGWAPFADFVHHAAHANLTNGVNFRENSIDGLVRATAFAFGGTGPGWLIAALKAGVLLAIAATTLRNVRFGSFAPRRGPDAVVLDALPGALLFMVLASPVVWEHHPVFLALPYLLAARRLRTPWEWVAFAFAYGLEFLAPTFDFYPWSLGRLASPLVLTVLLWRTAAPRAPGAVAAFERRLDAPFGSTV